MVETSTSEFEKRENKKHRKRTAGRKADKKSKDIEKGLTPQQRNPKAFTFNSVVKAERQFRRTADIKAKKTHVPLVDRTPLEPPPIVVAIVGPPKVGKSTLLQTLIKSFTRQKCTNIQGPVTIVSGKKRRLTLIECNNDINCMIDVAKVADLVLLLVDASFGFEMEVFEFLNICQIHGFPKIMGVLTHLDHFKKQKLLQRTKRAMKHRFWTEVYQGAKLFYLSGMQYGEYHKQEIHNLGRFISVMKFHPMPWRNSHPYLLADRLEDITNPEDIRQNPKCDRNICLYGFVRGVHLKNNMSAHIPGCGDVKLSNVTYLSDPCPLPDRLKQRSLVEKEKKIYAPFSGVGGIVYDKDAVYIELAGSHSHKEENEDEPARELSSIIQDTQETIDAKIAKSRLQVFTSSEPLVSSDYPTCLQREIPDEELVSDESGRMRRKAIFNDDDIEDESSDDSSEEEELPKKRKKTEEDHDKSWKKVNKNVLLVATSVKSENQERKRMQINLQEGIVDETSDIEDLEKVTSINRDKSEYSIEEDDIVDSDNDAMVSDKDTKVEDDNSSDDASSDSEDSVNETEKSSIKNMTYITKKFPNLKSSEKDTNIRNKISDALKMLDKTSKTKDDEFETNSDEMDSATDEDASEMETESDSDESFSADASAAKWKENLTEKAANSFYRQQNSTRNLVKLVYGKSKITADEDDDKDDLQLGGLFHVISETQKDKAEEKAKLNAIDTSKNIETFDFELDEIKDCFVTGKWKVSQDAEELLKMDDEDMDGDFEDLETGNIHTATEDHKEKEDKAEDKAVVLKEEKTALQKRLEKKQKLKSLFNSEYDDEQGEKNFYEDLKQEVDTQAKLNLSEFEGMDDSLRVQYEGFRPGMYVRVEIENVSCELITNFDPTYPLIIGGLLPGEENIGFVHARLKRHRWYKPILKTNDPLIISMGWRRFQTLPLYAVEDDNGRQRLLKYTPEHMYCHCHFYGPVTPQGTGLLAVQSVGEVKADFRISATGVVLSQDKSVQVCKKLKLVGTPLKIYKKTAFIKDMFHSELEVAKYEGAKIRTVSGIRGQIKRALNNPKGSFRAMFEDKILLSDIVFCRTWCEVKVPRFYNPITSLLLPLLEKNKWMGMKTVGQLKREKNIRNLAQPDSMYTAIARKPKHFKPLVVPKSLQRELPYKDKPKLPPTRKTKSLESQRVAIVVEPEEKKALDLMRAIKTAYKFKQDTQHEVTLQKKEQYRKQMLRNQEKNLKRHKELKKRVFRALSKMDGKKEGSGGRKMKKR